MIVSQQFIVQGTIVTKARPRARIVNNKYAQMYTPKTTANYENLIKVQYENQCNHYFGESPLKVDICAYFVCPKAEEHLLPFGLQCVNKKDLDNIAKTVLDALNGIAYKDDKQVISLTVSKKYISENETERIEVSISNTSGTLEEAKKDYLYQKQLKRYLELKNKNNRSKKEEERMLELEKEINKYRDYELPF